MQKTNIIHKTYKSLHITYNALKPQILKNNLKQKLLKNDLKSQITKNNLKLHNLKLYPIYKYFKRYSHLN
jgi:hypothetical protein